MSKHFLFPLFFCLSLVAAVAQSKIDSTKKAKPVNNVVTIIGVGDIMMGTTYPEPVLPPSHGSQLMAEVDTILSKADITMGNLEGVLLDEGGTPKRCKNPSICYVFRSPTEYVQNLVKAGFDVMSLANNHAGDFGGEGRQSSMNTLEKAGISYAGQVEKPYTIIEREGKKFGFVAFAPNSNCISINDIDGAKAIVKRLDSLCDIVIVSFHGGAEGAAYQHVPRKSELFYGENRGDVYKFAHTLIDVGADVVFGHGPHVTRAVEVYKNRFIAYSLGNFCTYGGINVAGINGWAPIMKVFTDGQGKFIKGQIIPTYQVARDRVYVDKENRVIKKVQELTKKDFPEVPVRIDDTGLITYLGN